MGASDRDHREREEAPVRTGEAPAPAPVHGGLERLAGVVGNAAMGTLIQRAAADPAAMASLAGGLGTAATPGIMRQYQTTAPPAPAADAGTGEVDPQLEKEWKAELRRIIGDRMVDAARKYGQAAVIVKKEVEDKKAQPSLAEQLTEMAIGALAPGYLNMAIKPLKEALRGVASLAIEKAVKDGTKQVETFMKADELVEKYITMDGDKAKSGFKALKKIAAGKPKDIPAGPAPDAPATATGGPQVKPGTTEVNAMLARFDQTFSEYVDNVNNNIFQLDRAELLGVWAAFDPRYVTTEGYAAQIRDLVKMHEEFTEGVEMPEGGAKFNFEKAHEIRFVEAWGVKKPAYLYHHPGSASIANLTRAHYRFVKWVPAEMAQSAAAIASQYPVARPGQGYPGPADVNLQGHVDDPQTEGEKVVQVDMWGKNRLCWANLEGGKGTFMSWIPEKERSFGEAKAKNQPGGFIVFDPKNFRKGDIPKPPAD